MASIGSTEGTRASGGVASEELFKRSLSIAPGGVHSPVRAFKGVGGTPVFFRSAEGAWLTDVSGRRYVDFCMSFGPLLLGHRDPEVSRRVHEMVDTAWTFGACEPYSLELGEWMRARLPWVERLRFVSSGTEAVMSALRVARAATGRQKVLKFDGCYHGHLDGLLVKSGSGLAGESCSDSAGVPESVAASTLVVPLDDLDAFHAALDRHGHELACVAIEPLPANYGLLPQTPAFLRAVAEGARRVGALLLWDEVISGFRVERGGMVARTDIRPDLVCYGKVLGGGFNVACYAGRADLMELVAPAGRVYQAGTLSANPIGMRAGLATLQRAEALGLWPALEQRTAAFCGQLNDGFASAELGWRASHEASLFWLHGPGTQGAIRAISGIPANHKTAYAGLFHELLRRGVYLAPSGYEVGFVSWAHTTELLREAADAILDAAIASRG
jgi:glutamate-1-semialdehyde 2,1-aminomutase